MQYTIIALLENHVGRTDRYQYAKIKHHDKMLFMKKPLVAKERENLSRELVWADFVTANRQLLDAIAIRSPRDMKLLDADTFVCEWLDGRLLVGPGCAHDWVQHIERYVDLLAVIDEASLQYVVPDRLQGYRRRQPLEQVEWWLRDMKLPPIADRARKLLEQWITRLHYTMQHGDLTPWQIIVVGDEWVVIDGERSGDDLPRFNDVAYSFGRLALRCNDESSAWRLLNLFIDRRSLNDQERRELYVVMIFRLLGMLGDSMRHKDADEQSRAERLLAFVVNKLSAEM